MTLLITFQPICLYKFQLVIMTISHKYINKPTQANKNRLLVETNNFAKFYELIFLSSITFSLFKEQVYSRKTQVQQRQG